MCTQTRFLCYHKAALKSYEIPLSQMLFHLMPQSIRKSNETIYKSFSYEVKGSTRISMLCMKSATCNRPFSYSTKEPGSSDIFIQIYARGSKEWRYSFDRNCAHSKTLQIVMKYRSIHIRFQNS